MITIIDNITPASQQLLWLNRDNEPAVVASKKPAMNGALHVQQTAITIGKKITLGTLESGLDTADFIDLQVHSASNLESFPLQVEGQTIQVMWDHTEGAAVTGEDVFQTIGGSDTKINVTLRFLTA